MLFTMYDLRAIKTNKGIVLLALTGPDPEKDWRLLADEYLGLSTPEILQHERNRTRGMKPSAYLYRYRNRLITKDDHMSILQRALKSACNLDDLQRADRPFTLACWVQDKEGHVEAEDLFIDRTPGIECWFEMASDVCEQMKREGRQPQYRFGLRTYSQKKVAA